MVLGATGYNGIDKSSSHATGDRKFCPVPDRHALLPGGDLRGSLATTTVPLCNIRSTVYLKARGCHDFHTYCINTIIR